ncbi:hypothetical protein [Ureaplasma urealyticum]|uniref:Uncharacterized protein n=1 Tax=Ureaplasma urealyticum serovar 10 (strain ATCC 33699 / Western) TaxID=565575 RepID=B5ZBW3_UREU1|nr:hypothetical protein [Ureaplasma urealyticum]EDX53774.1 conserved hypothetical protein [Ureaplasma urealyticum serovar 9 str. ATCC 33175]ACI60124.1 conserved hypothetical protein [Ureaplasma urealyticum serovar 10 str. ATCC 33699]EDU05956.1 conserved hypothetical protein [Ureaplasma urealyticum serovar 5 str. ATCC 27817]EDU57187.1 conserved hypothetical protein [Ureaplasma urealyticum serovar 7 str. ATCC 27819]EEH02453.1 conserved hypothetical protein [Ureaplasma urealyticum serovar 2 str. 
MLIIEPENIKFRTQISKPKLVSITNVDSVNNNQIDINVKFDNMSSVYNNKILSLTYEYLNNGRK